MPKSYRQKIDLADIEYRARPHEAFGRLREMGPLVPARLPMVGNLYLVTTYQAVDEVLKHDHLFCRDPRNAGRRNFPLLQLMLPGLFQRISQNMLGADEPDHRRLRTLVDKAFQRQSIAELRPRITEITDRQIQRVADRAPRRGDEIDMIEHLARPIPLAVICELLGLPDEDRANFKKWFSSFSRVKSVWGIARVVPGLRKTLKYLRGQFRRVKQDPRPGLITALVEVEQEGERLSEEELQAMVMLLLLAGHETTVHLISNSILTVLQLPDVRRTLVSDWSRVEPAVEEMLRYNSPAQFAKPRFVTGDTTFHGQTLRRGEMVMPVLASANCDPARFDRPNQFEIDREDKNHLGFGGGPHVCLGLKLARAETQIVLQQLFSRWPDLQPAFEPALPDWSRRLGMRSLNSLVCRLGKELPD